MALAMRRMNRWQLCILPLALFRLGMAETRTVFEVRGEVIPHDAAAVTLQAVASPFATSTLTGADGAFRFRNIEAGAYTVSAYVPQRGETRITIHVGPSVADKRGRITISVNTQGAALSRDSAAVVSARTLKIPGKARREYAEAERRLGRRDVEGAIAALERAVAVEPRFAAAWNHLGTIAYQTQRFPEAVRYFRKGVEADPAAYEPVVNLGGVLLNVMQPAEALRYNAAAVLRRPNDALAQSQLGMTYLLLGKLDPAEEHLLAARKLDPRHFSNPQLHLAELYERRKEFGRAADQLEDFLEQHPDWPYREKVREEIARCRARSLPREVGETTEP